MLSISRDGNRRFPSFLFKFLIFHNLCGAPYGNRTRVSAVKGRCPRPLDEGRNRLAAEKAAQSARHIETFAKRRKSDANRAGFEKVWGIAA
jgi:hypothetical protein